MDPLSDQAAPPKRNFGCLKIILVAAGVCAFLFVIIVVLVWQSVNWLKNAPDPIPVVYTPLKLSGGEQEDIDRVMIEIEKAKQTEKLYEDYVTPAVLNGFFEKVFEGERLKGKKNVPSGLRAELVDNDKMGLKFTSVAEGNTTPDGKPLYINAEAVFELEIVDGQIQKVNLDRLFLRKREAPLLSRMVVNYYLNQFREGKLKEQNGKPDEGLQAIKLLKRDGDRIHFILDGKALLKQEQEKEKKELENPPKSTQPPVDVQPEKAAF